MNGSNVLRITPRLIVGLAILSLGILWTLDNMDYLESERIVEWWPAVLIVIGALKALDPRGRTGGFILALIGTVLLLGNLDVIDWDIGDLFPLLIALVGAKLIWDAVRRKQVPAADSDPNSVVHAFAMMGGIHRQITSQQFRGGDANAIMGGVELDLRQAKLEDGETAVLDAFAMWGGVELTVPEGWQVDGEVMPLLGGFDDKTTNRSGSGPKLLVRGAAVMGAIVVKN